MVTLRVIDYGDYAITKQKLNKHEKAFIIVGGGAGCIDRL